MRRTAQTPAWPESFNPTRVPSPQDPVGRKREHTPRNDSRQWSVGSSKNRQTSLQGTASGQQGQIPSPNNPYGRRRSYMQRAESRQLNSDSHTGIFQEHLETTDPEPRDALLPGLQTPDLEESRAHRQKGLRKHRREDRAEQTQGDDTRRADRCSEEECPPEEKTNGRERPMAHDHETRPAEFAPGPDFMQLTSHETDDGEHISRQLEAPETEREDVHVPTGRVVMPKFQASEFVNLNTPCVSPSHSSQVGNSLERVRHRCRALDEVLNGNAGHYSEFDSEIGRDVEPLTCRRPGPKVAMRSPSAIEEPRRPSWARVGHHGIRPWDESHGTMERTGTRSEPGILPETGSFQWPSSLSMEGVAEQAPEGGTNTSQQMNALISQVEAGIQDTRNVSSDSSMSAWRDAAIDAVLQKSAEAEAETDAPRPIPPQSSRQNLRASVIEQLQRNVGASGIWKTETEDELGIARMETLRRNQAALIDTTLPAPGSSDPRHGRATNRRRSHLESILPSQESRFVEHLPENEDKLKRLGLAARKRRGSVWFQSLRRKAK
ncbi:hypothetical protein BST61_g1591 [Cercospora zeina]